MSAFGRILAMVGDVPEGGFLVAVSGGADSAVAAAVVREVGDEVRLIHLDHGTPASPRLGDAAEKLAVHLGAELSVEKLEIGSGSWEDAARRARREALAAAARDSDVIVTGHHRDDVAETLLGHLVRGSGVRGLASLRSRTGRYWRPLHAVGRDTVRCAARELGLPYVDDPANEDPTRLRNVIRHEILPALERLNPSVRDAIARTARHAAADEDALDAFAAGIPIRRADDAWVVPVAALETVGPAVAGRVLARLLRRARPPYGGSAAELSRLEGVVAGVVRSTELAGGLTAAVEGPMLAVYETRMVPAPQPVALPVPGSVVFGDWRVSAAAGPARPHRSADTAALDGTAVGATLEVRCAGTGERVDIAGGTKRVGRCLAEAGVPARLRSGWPVVTAHGKIAWVVGTRVAEWARAAPASDAVLVVGERVGG